LTLTVVTADLVVKRSTTAAPPLLPGAFGIHPPLQPGSDFGNEQVADPITVILQQVVAERSFPPSRVQI